MYDRPALLHELRDRQTDRQTDRQPLIVLISQRRGSNFGGSTVAGVG